MNDLLVKSMQALDHLKHLDEFFNILQKFQMNLNPAKCPFVILSGKFLRHVVTWSGIEANSKKI